MRRLHCRAAGVRPPAGGGGEGVHAERIGVDVHVWRVTNRWGIIAARTPEAAIPQLEAALPLAWDLLRVGGYRMARQILTLSSRGDAFSKRDLAHYRDAWSRPGALTAMINWYRALRKRREPDTERVPMPTLNPWLTDLPLCL